jgi:Na+/alanine symporter
MFISGLHSYLFNIYNLNILKFIIILFSFTAVLALATYSEYTCVFLKLKRKHFKYMLWMKMKQNVCVVKLRHQ